jgi:hypothetical protein
MPSNSALEQLASRQLELQVSGKIPREPWGDAYSWIASVLSTCNGRTVYNDLYSWTTKSRLRS